MDKKGLLFCKKYIIACIGDYTNNVTSYSPSMINSQTQQIMANKT